ncbi:MAG: zinc-dependent peptidase [Pirellulaceae bacterium]
MFFSWLKRRRRRSLRFAPLPEAWREILVANVHHYAHLPELLRRRLEEQTKVFVAEKWWEGCEGLEITDEIRVTIAGNACLLLLGSDDDFCFDRVQTVLVYPGRYIQRPERQPRAGVVTDMTPQVDLGVSWHHGPVTLSWPDVLRAGRGRDRRGNVVVHEFAHKLDELNGDTEGVPPLPDADLERRWKPTMQREYEQLQYAVEEGLPTPLDEYGLTNRAEFFAVATESFFEHSEALHSERPELYALLRDFYRVDPMQWTP